MKFKTQGIPHNAGFNQPTPKEVAEKKPRIFNPDKSVSTERSITIQTDKGIVNIPNIREGKQLSPREAIRRSKGEKRPIFKTKGEAVSKAKRRSKAIGKEIQRQKKRR